MLRMERPNLLTWAIPIITSAAAVVTAWAGHNMVVTLPWAIGLYAGLAGLGIVAYLWQLGRWKDERLKCEGGCIGPWVRRRDLWLLDGEKGSDLPYVCGSCFFRITGEAPHASPRTKRAF